MHVDRGRAPGAKRRVVAKHDQRFWGDDMRASIAREGTRYIPV